jgi:hypothetical protein
MLTKEQTRILKNQIDVLNLGQEYEVIAAQLNHTPMVANLVPAKFVQRTYDITELLALLQPTELTSVLDISTQVFVTWINTQLKRESFSAKFSAINLLAALAKTATGTRTVLDSIGELVNRQDRSLLTALVSVLNASGVISSNTKTVLVEYLGQTMSDPNYEAQIPGLSLGESLGLPLLTAYDVQEADCYVMYE